MTTSTQDQAQHHHRVDYLELPATDLTATKRFYGAVFGWRFEDYGPEYTSFQDGRMNGGFYQVPSVSPGGALLVLYSRDLEASLERVRQEGGRIVKEPFSFPGGRRFHFADPSGNELAVWTEP